MRRYFLIAALAACGSEKPTAGGDARVAPSTPSTEPAAAEASPTAGGTRNAPLNPRLLRRFKPLREDLAQPDRRRDEPLVALGRMLYFEKRLSAGHDLSCNSCHPLDKYGADGKATSPGHESKMGSRNSPSTFHAAGLVAQFWDGREPDVERQAPGPMMNPVEMASSPERVVSTLSSMPEYGTRFAAAFPGEKKPITVENVGIAIGAFERGLVTPARWDNYLRGDTKALTAEETEGLRIFTNVGCMTCHTGEFLGGTSFQAVGVAEPWPNTADRGRMTVTKATEDDMVFRVPSLRNVVMTGPYFHDGSAATLDEAIDMMGNYQLGIELTPKERASIATWMKALTGDLPTEYIKEPALPASTASTPLPNSR
jgi:cytochrome c peroxidase